MSYSAWHYPGTVSGTEHIDWMNEWMNGIWINTLKIKLLFKANVNTMRNYSAKRKVVNKFYTIQLIQF